MVGKEELLASEKSGWGISVRGARGAGKVQGEGFVVATAPTPV